MDDDNTIPFRASTRTRKISARMGAALADTNTRSQAAIARLDALESDNAGIELIDAEDEDEGSLDDEDQVFSQRKQAKGAKRRTRQAKALETARKAPRSFLELLQEGNLEVLPTYVPTYVRAAVGPPSSSARRHFCTVCGYFANYTCTQCSARFCSCRCQKVHNDTRCQKFVA